MRRMLINTQNFLFGDAISEALEHAGSDFEITKAEKPDEVAEISRWFIPHTLLMEVSGCTPWLIEERLKIRDEVMKINPHCKIVLIVDEVSEKQAAQKVKQAKRDGLIDQFIYGSTSASFLVAIMDTL